MSRSALRRGARVFAAASVLALLASNATAQEGPARQDKPLELFGLRIGASIEAVKERFPTTVVNEEVYTDERVGDRYKLVLGRTVPREFNLRGWEEGEKGLITVDAAFTGERQMHELIVQARDETLVCDDLRAGFIEKYGPPDFTQQKARGWVRLTLDDRRFLRLDCVDGEYYLGHLYSSTLQDRYLAELRRKIEPVILNTLNMIQ